MQRWPSEAEMVLEVERDLDTLITLKAREELEDMYGIPFIVRLSQTSFCHYPDDIDLAYPRLHLLPAPNRVDCALAWLPAPTLCGLPQRTPLA